MKILRSTVALLPSGIAVALTLAGLLGASYSVAQNPRAVSHPPTSQDTATVAKEASTPQLTQSDIEAFMDGLVPLQLQRENIAGSAITIVKDGKVIFSKGYGYADVKSRAPVSAETTMFRAGSVSKLFTWTAVMQLVEQGKLDLDRDINDYIDFKIPEPDGKPITLRDLMTHRGGFEETVEQLWVPTAQDVRPLQFYLHDHMPRELFAPGTIPAYSNYGCTLAGYIVERASGQPYAEYVEDHIFKPLGMAHASFRQPLPAGLQPLMSTAYRLASQPPHPFEFVNVVPAGALSVSAGDMGKFMMAHLRLANQDTPQIFKPETAQLMHTGQFTNVPGMNAGALGFFEESRNGHRIIGHTGETMFYHSAVHLIPDVGLGFFITQTGDGKGEISYRGAIWEKFLDRYFPYTAPANTFATNPADLRDVAGTYISSRRADNTILKAWGILGMIKVVRNSDDTLSIAGVKDFNGNPKRLIEVAPLIFREEHGQGKIGFKRDHGMLLDLNFPFEVFLKAPAHDSLYLPVLIYAAVVFALVLLLWPIAAIIRRHYGKSLELKSRESLLRWILRVICLTNLIFLLGMVLAASAGAKNLALLGPQSNGTLRCLQFLGWIGVLATTIAVYSGYETWTIRSRSAWSKVSDTLVALAFVGFTWALFSLNLLNWSLRY